jgi:hypothetical protein
MMARMNAVGLCEITEPLPTAVEYGQNWNTAFDSLNEEVRARVAEAVSRAPWRRSLMTFDPAQTENEEKRRR